MRVGIGYDVHRLVDDRKLILGGIEIPYEKGLLGHSDADVLIHAIMDSLLGAAGMGDIGKHFPDSSEEFKGISSVELLKEVNFLIHEKGYLVNNIDATIVAEKPKLASYILDMELSIAEALDIQVDRINVKATTTEKLGFEGRGEGISTQAIASII